MAATVSFLFLKKPILALPNQVHVEEIDININLTAIETSKSHAVEVET